MAAIGSRGNTARSGVVLYTIRLSAGDEALAHDTFDRLLELQILVNEIQHT